MNGHSLSLLSFPTLTAQNAVGMGHPHRFGRWQWWIVHNLWG